MWTHLDTSVVKSSPWVGTVGAAGEAGRASQWTGLVKYAASPGRGLSRWEENDQFLNKG